MRRKKFGKFSQLGIFPISVFFGYYSSFAIIYHSLLFFHDPLVLDISRPIFVASVILLDSYNCHAVLLESELLLHLSLFYQLFESVLHSRTH